MAFPYLQEMATRYARAAVAADKDGDYETAINNYRKAIEILTKIVRMYPDSPLISTYLEMIKSYEKRIQQLQSNTEAIESNTASKSNEKDSFINDIVLTQKPNVKFSDIADLKEAKQAIVEAIVYPVKRPDLFPLGWPRGILLFGPPGCGKTMLAAAVANEVNGYFLYVDAASIMSKWLGEAEKNVSKIFKYARQKSEEGSPAIIFIDEIDALLGTFSGEVGGEVRVRNQFLKEMDGIQDKDKKIHVYVIGATNKPWQLDEAFVRRFNKRILIPLPDLESRRQLFALYTKGLNLSSDVDLDRLAQLTEGYSASDIRDIIQATHTLVIREFFEQKNGEGEPRSITMEDFLNILKERKPSVDPLFVKRYDAWFEKFKAL
ncbi:AAA family ATPase [Fervidicoccus fontis]|jgi:SpoVK/Ycf46/Vps4 family AAA+-type ATPase|uniref:Cell division protein CdvC n=2 Tax=Fervidicoccus fontis TaxID=683846 RepID=I0A071_FERFK|nr:AAA family ATPase [Fervidicoccus fontis]AFH42378.1 cell division protein CdvC [Fervidicoccus fontis Kam940]MBE9391695.1 AAA family ATPase [Fervidicoccus fontis]PMB76124.1 MAG: ATP-dependent zinc metalloprotease FtsH [Fervidicoccus fontis]PMB77651.1 MAG: ATP-dependent zinc metalloprotease FtsH [Fervidicoccus fontis]HEW64412.1 AAA family ATPase [Fervidicoccus fontis]